MKRGNKVLTRFAILVLFAYFMYPRLLYKSIISFTTEEINSNHRGFAWSNLMQPKQLEECNYKQPRRHHKIASNPP